MPLPFVGHGPEASAARFDEKQKTALAASVSFAKALDGAVSAGLKLERARRAVADAVAEATELHPDGNPDLPLRDEDELLDELVELHRSICDRFDEEPLPLTYELSRVERWHREGVRIAGATLGALAAAEPSESLGGTHS